MAILVFPFEDGREIVVPVDGIVSLGTGARNNVIIEDPTISSTHAEIIPTETGEYLFRDLSSESGSFINGTRVETHKLGDGDEISFGSVRGWFRFGENPEQAITDPGQGVSEEATDPTARAIIDSEIQNQTEKLQRIEKEKLERQQEVDQLRDLIAGLKSELADVRKELQQAATSKETPVAKEAAPTPSKKTQKQDADWAKKTEKARAALEEQERKLAEIQAQILEAEKKRDSAHDAATKQAGDAHALREQAVGELDQLGQQLAGVRAQIVEAEKKRDAAQEAARQATEVHTARQQALSELDQQHHEIQSSLSSRQKELAEAGGKVASIAALLAAAKLEQETFVSQKSQIETEHQALLGQHKQLGSAHEQLSAENQKLAAEHQALTAKHAEISEERRQWKEKDPATTR